MTEMRKITAILPAQILDTAVGASGASLTETLRIALKHYSHHVASQRLLAMRGRLAFERDWRDLRGKDDA